MSHDDDGVTYEMRYNYANNLIDDIQNISDLDYQQRSWVEGSIPNVVDSWEETMCMFFDDRDIDNFLNDIDPGFGLTQYQINMLRWLRDKADYYCSVTPKYMNPRDVIADPRWHEVVACAQETLKAFEGYEVPRDDEIEA